MGVGNVTAAITDAGPLIHLAEIGNLALLDIFGVLHVPDAVWSEAIGLERVAGDDVWALGNVQRHSLPKSQIDEFVQENSLEHLQAGERECLLLGQQIGVATLLTDDLAVRKAAKQLSLTPVGSLGVVVGAYRLGRIPLDKAERRIADLYDVSSLFVTRAIVELAIEQLYERLV